MNNANKDRDPFRFEEPTAERETMKQAANNETFECDSERRFGKTGRTWHGTNGTVVFLDAFNRWNRETTDGRERTFATAREASSGVFEPVEPPALASRGATFGSYLSWCLATGRTVS